MSTLESLVREMKRQIEDAHRQEATRLGLAFDEKAVHETRGTWVVPVTVGMTDGDASALTDLLRTIRRSLEGKIGQPVTVLLDPYIDNAA